MLSHHDMFQLFGEIAGRTVRKIVPASHILDSTPMLAYLTIPISRAYRKTNFTQTASNHLPCPADSLTTPATCVQLVNTRSLCHYGGRHLVRFPTLTEEKRRTIRAAR